jgi:hypothetical protein
MFTSIALDETALILTYTILGFLPCSVKLLKDVEKSC